MSQRRKQLLHRVQKNDPTLIELFIDPPADEGIDYAKLGAAIGKNTHLTELTIFVLADTNNMSSILNGLRQNSSIHNLSLSWPSDGIVPDDMKGKILKALANNDLTQLRINSVFEGFGHLDIANTLRSHSNLKEVYLNQSNINNEQLLPILETLRSLRMLETFHLSAINNSNQGIGIGSASCKAIATLLQDPNSNLRTLVLAANKIDDEGTATIVNGLVNNTKLRELDLSRNRIGNVGSESLATLLRHPSCNLHTLNLQHNIINKGLIAIANGLVNNTNLKKINLGGGNQIDQSVIQDVFSTLLCNTTSVNDTYTSIIHLKYYQSVAGKESSSNHCCD